VGKVNHTRFLVVICIILLGLTQIPYILAFSYASPDKVFSGLLMNPLDGNSYLAKMYEGYRGDWLFTLPYTAQIGDGTFLFFFYILLGHLARIFHLPLVFVYHFMRALSSVCLILALADLFKALFKDNWSFRLAMIMACFGSGMGWLAMPTGYVTSDFWVAEAYPFLSALVNPHFCLAGALMVWVIKTLIENRQPVTRWRYVCVLLASLIIGLVSPFGVMIIVILECTLIAVYLYRGKRDKEKILTNEINNSLYYFLFIILGGAPILLYEVYVVNVDPLLQGWNVQNITASPPIWDLVLSFSPLLILAIIGVIIAIRQKMQLWIGVVAWMVFGIIFVYFPWSLQRRFLFGLYIPIVLLATLAVQYIKNKSFIKTRHFNLLLSVILVVIFMTNLLLEMTIAYGIKTKDSLLFLSGYEYEALKWIEHNTPSDALVLASPQMGLFIPAQTGRRVIYGHPFETVEAEKREEQVTQFFENFGAQNLQSEYLMDNNVDYIFWGPRERLLSEVQSGLNQFKNTLPVFTAGDVVIFQVKY